MTPLFLALYSAVRGIILVGLLLLTGTQCTAVLFRRSIRHTTPERLRALGARLAPVPIRLAAALLVFVLLRGAFQLWSFRDADDPITGALARSVLLGAGWGHAWLAQLGISAVLLSALAVVRPDTAQPRWWIAALILGLIWTQSGMGHAAGDQWPWVLGRLLDSSHLLGAGLWLGTLGVIGITATPVLTEPSDLPAMATLVRGFSYYARTGAALAVTSGVVAAVVYAGSLHLFLASTWGKLLLAKVCVLAAVAGLGWYNWRVATPGLETGEIATPKLLRSIRVELALGVLMVAITAVLVASALPGEG